MGEGAQSVKGTRCAGNGLSWRANRRLLDQNKLELQAPILVRATRRSDTSHNDKDNIDLFVCCLPNKKVGRYSCAPVQGMRPSRQRLVYLVRDVVARPTAPHPGEGVRPNHAACGVALGRWTCADTILEPLQ